MGDSVNDPIELESMKKLIGIFFVIIVVLIMLVKVFAFNTAQKKISDSDYKIVIGGGLAAGLIISFCEGIY
jgi:hypothetical protein